ncbi:flavin-containing monooxygenase [Streptomyces sp. CA-100214]
MIDFDTGDAVSTATVQPGLDDDGIDREALRRKYAQERAKRLRRDALDQYRPVEGYEHDDPWTPFTEREPVNDHVRFTFVGGGWAGLLSGAALHEQGVTDLRIVDAAGGFGGVWYWNRYPGVMCDSPSMIYLPLLEETGYIPTEKYVHGPEIRLHCERIATKYGLHDKALFHTKVESVTWDEDNTRWAIVTNRGDRFTSDFVGVGLGQLNIPKLPAIPGIETFSGKSFHSSRWDYTYTGGTPEGAPMTGLADKRVAIIGTGATAIQAVPELSRDAGELFVFQRTPSAVDARDNGPIDLEWFRSVSSKPGWQRDIYQNHTRVFEGLYGIPAMDEEVSSILGLGGTLAVAQTTRRAIHSVPDDQKTPENIKKAIEDIDFINMERIRARADEIVKDSATANSLKAWYRQLCKRPTYHDEYLESFNNPNTHLIDTDGKGVERITEHGIVANGVEYEVDCIVWASGFQFSAEQVRGLNFEINGSEGRNLGQEWATTGLRSLHGMHINGYPNLFVVQLSQGAYFGANVPTGWLDAAQSIAAVVDEAAKRGARRAEVTQEAQDAWVELLLTKSSNRGDDSCTPSYYNNEGGEAREVDRLTVPYPGGPTAFFQTTEKWRTEQALEGINFR